MGYEILFMGYGLWDMSYALRVKRFALSFTPYA